MKGKYDKLSMFYHTEQDIKNNPNNQYNPTAHRLGNANCDPSKAICDRPPVRQCDPDFGCQSVALSGANKGIIPPSSVNINITWMEWIQINILWILLAVVILVTIGYMFMKKENYDSDYFQ